MRALPILATLAVASPALADVDPQITEAIAKVKPTDFPSANSITILSDQSVVYQADGQFTNTQHIARLVLTTAGKADVASTSMPYAKDAETLEVLSARVVKKDGKLVAV